MENLGEKYAMACAEIGDAYVKKLAQEMRITKTLAEVEKIAEEFKKQGEQNEENQEPETSAGN